MSVSVFAVAGWLNAVVTALRNGEWLHSKGWPFCRRLIGVTLLVVGVYGSLVMRGSHKPPVKYGALPIVEAATKPAGAKILKYDDELP